MSSIKLTADSGGGSVSLKAPATTTSNAALEITVPDVATGSSVVTKTSANKVGLNVDPEVTLHVHTAHANSLIKASGTTSGSGINDGLDIGINGSNGILWNRENGELQLATNNTERLTVKSTGHVELVSGNLEFANGAGIDFSNKTGGAAGATSNQLSDYEEGAWTPTFIGAASNPTITYDAQEGRYTKIGRVVLFETRVRTDSVSGGAATALYIDGLPFTSVNSNTGDAGGAITFSDLWTEGTHPFSAFINKNWPKIALYKNNGSGDSETLKTEDLATSNNKNDIRIAGHYITAT